MSRLFVRLLTVPAAVTVAAAAVTLDPRSLAGAERFAIHEAEVLTDADDPELTAANRQLTARLELVSARTAAKEDLCELLMAGRISLAAATDAFLQLNADAPECLAAVRMHFPAPTDRESAARNVLSFVGYRAPAADRGRLTARLAAEYRALFGSAQAVSLN